MHIRKYNIGGRPQGQPQQAPIDINQLLEMLSQMPTEAKLSPEEVARFIMGDLPVNIPQDGGKQIRPMPENAMFSFPYEKR